jgi:hypothetical protein
MTTVGFWAVMSCSLEIIRYFEGAYSLHMLIIQSKASKKPADRDYRMGFDYQLKYKMIKCIQVLVHNE